ncbi:MAG: methyltransferase domain-containing protein [Marinobacter sp.]|uniref:class I SAM-dependent methyltransferase n=1 Tax=Marinobacter sp. TaxID=50741 RepID=UPI00299DC15C|nr:methyltransferase domain-containing protein [Marinobacter sp.]MDX1633105.1 methyltransferase domain-containing protein [Marinobacter sp.]
MSRPGSVDYPQRHADFEHWFQTPLGRALLADQRCCVDHLVAPLTGARQLHVGVSHRLPLASGSDFSQRITSTPHWQSDLPDGVVVCDADELPFPSESMDLVIMHHSTDFSAFPHQVVREASRVLRGGGQLLILGFNPISLWGLRKFLFRHRSGPWGGRFMMRSRMEDWLSLLDFQVESSRSHFLRPPLQRAADLRLGLGQRLAGTRFLPIGAYYCILASKRVCAPIRKQRGWRRPNVVALPAGPIGASRGYQQGCPRTPEQETR